MDKTSTEDALSSVHTVSFPHILQELGVSILASTYQAGKLVMLRNEAGVLNTHFRTFLKPMGLAASAGKLAIGGSVDIWEFHNVPAVCAKLQEEELADEAVSALGGPIEDNAKLGSSIVQVDRKQTLHDACYLPRRCHVTGDVQIHDVAWAGDELWFVNTAFSCLATRSELCSFEPRWRPKFIEQLMPGDCCHLNGLAIRNGRAAFVTALGETNSPGGWRENKRDGGILIDVDSNEIVVRGLSMPHSPRWHRGELWLLESGNGSLGRVDLTTGKYRPLVELPGFTRGLAFVGPLAFVGLSQVRESAIFSGIPLVERLEERSCGVWVVNVETAQVVAFVRFEDAVQEIFAVEALVGTRFPDVINHDHTLISRSYVLPDDALKSVPDELKTMSQ